MVLRRQGNVLNAFYNNVQLANTFASGSVQPQNTPINLTRGGRIGTTSYDSSPPDYWTYGSIDDIRIYNRALTNSEINQLYHEGGW
jgi:hypothetical protein